MQDIPANYVTDNINDASMAIEMYFTELQPYAKPTLIL
jgi:hypothetical protein